MRNLQGYPQVDAIVMFAGGLIPKPAADRLAPYGMTHLSTMRILQPYWYLSNSGYKPTIITCGGQENYHTKVTYEVVPSEVYKNIFSSVRYFDGEEVKVISTHKGICTLTEALGAREVIVARNFKRIMYNSSKEHERRIHVMLEKVLDPGFELVPYPLSGLDSHFMNPEREKLLMELFLSHFAHYPRGSIPYEDDKKFYDEHIQYYQEMASVIEGTANKEWDDRDAYRRK